MSAGAVGALLGLLASVGILVAVRYSPPLRRPRLADRIAPYVLDTPPPSRLALRDGPTGSLQTVSRLIGPLVTDGARALDRLLGGAQSIRQRLAGLNSTTTVEEFRLEQLVWGALGLFGGALAISVLSTLRGNVSIPVILLGAAVGAVGGVLGRDWWLRRSLQQRERAILAEFPVVADLLALAVSAGEAPISALRRVCALTNGQLARDVRSALTDADAGIQVTDALRAMADRTTVESVARFVSGLVVALERGTPLADVLRAQAMDAREVGKRALLEAGGRKEIQMLVPVVFIVMPVTILFALYPGLVTIVSITN